MNHRPEDDDAELTRLETLIDAGADGDEDETYRDLGLERFRVLKRLGEGGMGQVLLARQVEPVERLVALKLIRQRMLSAANRARFDIERQALAQMSHPTIAQVYDAGTTPAGYPFFVMEYIEGTRLDAFCQNHRLTVRQRLELFIRICRGVQHAHLKGIVHRDLKPGNILVAMVDGIPMPKIIDFGIATAVDDEQTDQSRRDRAGTPQYMSPEQFSLDKIAIDTRSDVYSLGVILHELLVERPPLPASLFQSADGTQATEILERQQSLPPPSVHLIEGRHRDTIARSRGTTPSRLQRRLRKDLDAITLKALATDRDERYASPEELAADITNTLAWRPVSAVPATPAYRIRRFVRRHAIGLGSASAILLALIAGLTAATLGLVEARRQFEVAEQRRLELADVVGFQRSMLEGMDAQTMGIGLIEGFREQFRSGLARQANPTLTEADFNAVISLASGPDLARRVLDQHVLTRALESIETEFEGRPGLQASLYESVFSVYDSLGIKSSLPDLAMRILERRRQRLPETAGAVLDDRFRVAIALADVGEFERSQNQLEALLADRERRAAPDRERIIDIKSQMAINLVELGRTDEAQRRVRSTLAEAREWLGPDHNKTLQMIGNVGYVEARSGQLPAALEAFREQAELRRQRPEQNPLELTRALINLGAALGASGQLADALAAHEEAETLALREYGRRHPLTLGVMHNRGSTLTQLGRFEEAARVLEETYRLRAETMGNQHPVTLRTQLTLGSLYNRLERPDQDFELVSEVFEKRRSLLGEDHLDTLNALEIKASILIDRADHESASEALEQLVDRRSEQLGPTHPQSLSARFLTALNLLEGGRAEPAAALLESVLNDYRETEAADSYPRLNTAMALYRAYLALGEADRATALRGRELSLLDSADIGVADNRLESLRQTLTELPEP
jgi:non-specific serine/threonine protein kinase/serine/threonine-protein kinase